MQVDQLQKLHADELRQDKIYFESARHLTIDFEPTKP